MKENLVYNEKARVTISRTFTFDSAHYLKEYVGKCSNLHGHTYKLEVFVRGPLDDRGFVCDYGIIKDIVKTKVLDLLDHKNLSGILMCNTTAENMVVFIYSLLQMPFNRVGFSLVKVKLWETADSCAEYSGEMY